MRVGHLILMEPTCHGLTTGYAVRTPCMQMLPRIAAGTHNELWFARMVELERQRLQLLEEPSSQRIHKCIVCYCAIVHTIQFRAEDRNFRYGLVSGLFASFILHESYIISAIWPGRSCRSS